MFATTGVMLNSFSTYYPFFRELRGFTDSQLSLTVTFRSFAGILSMMFIDKYFKHFDIKKGMIVGVLLCVLALVMYAKADNIVMLLLATFTAGCGSSLSSTYPITILINRWFVKRKGLAISICLSGTGLSTVFIPNITVALIDKIGITSTLLVTAGFVALLGIGCTSALFDYPEKRGLNPFGYGEVMETEVKVTANNQASVSISGRLTAILLVAMALQGIASYETTQLFTLHYDNCGFTAAQSAAALSVWGGTLTAAKLVYGALADRFGIYKLNYFTLVVATLGVGLCCFAYTKVYMVILLAAVLIGISFPYNTIGSSLWASSLYRPEKYAKAYQKMNLSVQIGQMAFSFVPGLIAQKTGEYISSYAMFAVMMFVAIAMVQYVFKQHQKLESQ